jgi:hypothetical protein
MESFFAFIIGLPIAAKVILGILLVGIFFSILKKFLKFAILIAILVILLLVIMKLMAI